jgi:hypothetical protein
MTHITKFVVDHSLYASWSRELISKKLSIFFYFQSSDSKFGKQKINLSYCNNQITQNINLNEFILPKSDFDRVFI